MSASDEVAREYHEKFMRWSIIAAKFAGRLALQVTKEIIREAQDIKERVLEASDPAKAMQEEMDKAYRGIKDQIEELRVQGAIDYNQYKTLNNQMNDMAKYYDLDDGCLKAASMNQFKEYCQDLSDKFAKTQDKGLFKDITEKADEFAKIPRAIYMDEEKIPKNIKELKADVKIKNALKEMQKNITKTRINDGLDALIR